MKIRKAVITAAAPSQRDIPLQTLVDRDGERKSVLALQIAEMSQAGAEEVCVVVAPGTEEAYRGAIGPDAERVRFVIQDAPRGYGHALFQARDFVRDEPFLHQVGDHLFVYGSVAGHAAQQLAQVARENECSVSGVQATRESLLPSFGAMGGQRVRGTTDVYTVECVVEKPTPTEAEQTLIVPGLRAGNYLCFMGTHVLTPRVMELLSDRLQLPGNQSTPLSPILDALTRQEKYLAVEIKGRRFHLDTRWGLLGTQLALALSGDDRDTVLVTLTDLLLSQEKQRGRE